MASPQNSFSGSTLASEPSTSFSSTTSTIAGSKLLFGEIDSFKDPLVPYPSLCNLVLSYNPAFASVWNSDVCRSTLLSFLPHDDLVRLRLVCHDFSTRLAPAAFDNLHITFTSRSFSRPAKLAALDRVGHLVKTLTFTVAHTLDTQLPPLIDATTGEEKVFVFPPQVASTPQGKLRSMQPKYGDWETTDLLTRQYPPLFHAATNIDAFVKALSSLTNLYHLRICCPTSGVPPSKSKQKTIVEFALISLRIAIERIGMRALETLYLLHIQPRELLCLSPLLGPGANPASSRQWLQISKLTMKVYRPKARLSPGELKTVHAFIRTFNHVVYFDFRWMGAKGPSPLPPIALSCQYEGQAGVSPQKKIPHDPTNRITARHPAAMCKAMTLFPLLTHLSIENAIMSASHVRDVIASHSRTLEDITLESISITDGTWDQAFEPLRAMARDQKWQEQDAMEEMGDVPIMLAPSMVDKQSKKLRVHSSVPLQSVRTGINAQGECWPARSEQRKTKPRLDSNGLLCESDAAEGVRTILLADSGQPKKPKKRKRDMWTCHGVLRAVKGGLMSWR